MTPLNKPTSTLVSSHSIGEVYGEAGTGHHALISIESFNAGDIICKFQAKEEFIEPSRFTVQTGEGSHITLYPDYLQYINHSCHPNAFFDTDNYELVALQHIEPGDEFTFFYPSTEWKMSEQFKCLCSESNCLGYIQGAFNIAPEVLNKYRVTSFIAGKMKKLHQ